jgi:hypothetical protein
MSSNSDEGSSAGAAGKSGPSHDREEDESSLLVGALTTYLQPLLDKHASSNPTLVYEDLTASWHAAERFLNSRKLQGEKDRGSGTAVEHEAVHKRVADLHRSQVHAYRDAAVAGLKEFAARHFELPSVGELMGASEAEKPSKESYVQFASDLAMEKRPNWKVGSGILSRVVSATVKQRAGEAYDDYERSKVLNRQSGLEAVDEGDEEQEEGEEREDDVEALEEGQADEDESTGEDEDGLVTETKAEPSTASENKKKGGQKRKASLTLTKGTKANPRKKAAKAVPRPSITTSVTATRASARRGRGGASAAAK